MLHDDHQAVVVDPGDVAPVQAALDAHGLALSGILVTHHHPDHVGGLAALRPRLQGPVWGPARETIPGPIVPLNGGDSVTVMGLAFEVIDMPGHTAGHIACVHRPADGSAPILFCGDTLFSGGCGRLFEGAPAQMHQSLSLLATLPGDTQVCCAHEDTVSKLRLAAAVEPRSAAVADAVSQCQDLRARGLPTLPSMIAFERAVNPFIRCDAPAVIESALLHGAADPSGPTVLGALREWKNQFR